MDSIDITGEIIKIKDKQTFASGFEKQEVIIRDDSGKYPDDYPLEFVKDKIEKVASLRVGDTATFSCNLRGREWEGRDKWFLSLGCWKVESAGSNESTPATRAAASKVPANMPDDPGVDDKDEIPF